MGIIEICFIGLSLSMDAFAVSISKGLSFKNHYLGKAIIVGLYFGIFQALMPLIGYFFGSTFSSVIEKVDYWIAFIALTLLGINMIKESINSEEEEIGDRIDFKTMVVLSVATSIDALVVGVTFSFLKVPILLAASIIGVITFLLCVLGVILGNKLGEFLKNRASILGGMILILIGVKILLEHFLL